MKFPGSKMRTSMTPKNSNDNVKHRGFTSLRRRLRGFINGSMKFFCRFASTSSTDTSNHPSTTIQRSSPVVSTRLFDLPNELQLRILNCLPPEEVIKKRIVCKKWNRLIVKNKSQLQRFPISVTLR